jgi:hypothetical protein
MAEVWKAPGDVERPHARRRRGASRPASAVDRPADDDLTGHVDGGDLEARDGQLVLVERAAEDGRHGGRAHGSGFGHEGAAPGGEGDRVVVGHDAGQRERGQLADAVAADGRGHAPAEHRAPDSRATAVSSGWRPASAGPRPRRRWCRARAGRAGPLDHRCTVARASGRSSQGVSMPGDWEP